MDGFLGWLLFHLVVPYSIQGGPCSVRLQAGCGIVCAVLVFASEGSSAQRVLLFFLCAQRERVAVSVLVSVLETVLAVVVPVWLLENQGCENGVFGKRCFCPLPKTGGFDEKWRKLQLTFYPRKQVVALLRARKPTKMTRMAGVPQTKQLFTVCQKRRFRHREKLPSPPPPRGTGFRLRCGSWGPRSGTDMTGRAGDQTMEMHGGSTASYLAPWVP